MEKITRWFDENGKEIIREPVNFEELELITEVGGELEQSSLGINFYSEHLDKDEITELIGIQPTKSWNPNERHRMGNRGLYRMTNWGKWYFHTERDSRDINIKIDELLSKLTPNLNIWNKLTSKYEVWMDVAGYMNNWNRGFKLSPESMRMLSDRNLDIFFDLYFEEQDEEENSPQSSRRPRQR